MKEKGRAGFETSTCFMAWDVSEVYKFQIHNMQWDVSEVYKFQIHKQVHCKWWLLFIAQPYTVACQYPPNPAPHSINFYQLSFYQIWTVQLNALDLGGSYTWAVTLDRAKTPVWRLGVKWKALFAARPSFCRCSRWRLQYKHTSMGRVDPFKTYRIIAQF